MSINYQVIATGDGSHTLQLPGSHITFHSRRGAIQESQHVFIKAGLEFWLDQSKSKKLFLLEVGFGTGLNSLMTAIAARQKHLELEYTAIELNPLPVSVFEQLNYGRLLHEEVLYNEIVHARWNEWADLSPNFKLRKIHGDLLGFRFETSFDVIYFDAFAPDDQAEMWSENIWNQMREHLNPNGVMTTYCSKSMVRKSLLNAGFRVEKIPGPPGKREMIRARLLNH
ncbi:tRNA (5-methylaminomethyl-2-thiouridine)(34)-methyltransferase MnmD [Niabella insulamsoli]|uniref:tRNA (5-methylaminomethyl-2-thiouridine)(34)-methyltransferase MnmD n=1 Tax=Niabella insulamsoli TaxID=3144874 RepID=UPI0031FBA820